MSAKINIKNAFFCLIILFIHTQKAQSQISYDSLLKSICYNSKIIKFHADTTNAFDFIGKKNISYKLDNHSLLIETDSSSSLTKIKIDSSNIRISDIYNINDKLYSFDGIDLYYQAIVYFQFNNCFYSYLPLSIVNCHGSSCRYYMCLLIQIDSSANTKTFFFGNSELENDFYFRITEKGELIYLNITNSFQHPELFQSYISYLKNSENILYMITSFIYNEKTKCWNVRKDSKGKEYKIIFKAEDEFSKGKIWLLDKYWMD